MDLILTTQNTIELQIIKLLDGLLKGFNCRDKV